MNEIEKFVIEKFDNIQIHGWRELEKSKSSKVGKSYGPIYPCAEKYKYLMQFQNGDELSAQQPKPVSSSNIETIDTPLFWCGRFANHYGEFTARHISRIVVYKESKIKGKLCFCNKPTQSDTMRSWFLEILEHFGYSEEDVLIVNEPIIAKTLYVTPQNECQRQLSITSQYYLDLLDKNYPPKPLSEKKGIVYISRSQLPEGSSRIVGEDYLEFYFKKCGAKIVYPEQISVSEQLEIYNSARCIIMLEGSAYHTFQLFGRALGDVIIIKRRETPVKGLQPRRGGVHVCQSFVEPRCNSLMFYPSYNESEEENYLKRCNPSKKQTESDTSSPGRIYNYTKMMKDIMNVVKSIDESISDVEILKRDYTKFIQDDYIKYLKNEAEKINRLEKREIIPEVKTINKSIPNFEIPVFKKTMSYNDLKNFIKSEVIKINRN